MQFVSNGDKLHEMSKSKMSKPVYWKKKKYQLSAELAQRMVKVTVLICHAEFDLVKWDKT